jgi:TatD DNase family protein
MIDTHAHLFYCKRKVNDLVNNAKTAGLKGIINVALDLESAKTCIEIAEEHEMVFATAGLYPGKLEDDGKWDELKHLLAHPKVVALGEIGLDYFRVTTPKETQIRMLRTQLDIARELDMPVILHNRHSDEDMKEVLQDYTDVTKVLHCFGSPPSFVDEVINDTTYFSFTATVTYAKKGKTINGLRHIPLDHIMIETDCPYLTPESLRGEENQPAYVIETAKRIAEVKDIPLEVVLEKTTSNAISFFRLPIS